MHSYCNSQTYTKLADILNERGDVTHTSVNNNSYSLTILREFASFSFKGLERMAKEDSPWKNLPQKKDPFVRRFPIMFQGGCFLLKHRDTTWRKIPLGSYWAMGSCKGQIKLQRYTCHVGVKSTAN